MTDWTELDLQPENTTPFVDEGDWNLLVANDMNLQERLAALEMLYTGGAVPVGGVILWYGVASALPDGWQICDGTNSIADVRSRMIMGAANDGEIGATGGATEHTHTGGTVSTVSNHTHSLSSLPTVSTTPSPTHLVSTGSGSWIIGNAHYHYPYITIGNGGAHTHTLGVTVASDNMPPYKKLYWITKVSGA